MANNEQQLDSFNQQLRANPQYQRFLQSLGVNTNVAPGQAWRLSDQQRKQAESWVKSNIAPLDGLEIDGSGNANQNEGFGKQLKRWGPIAGGVALSMFGIPGVFPGLLSGGGGAAAGGAAALDAAPSAATSAANMANLGWTMAPAAATMGVAPAVATIGASAPAAAGGIFSGLKSLALPTAINAGANIAGSVMGSRAANNAARTQTEAGDRALAFLRQQYEDQQRNLQPYMAAGQGALTTLQNALPTRGVPMAAYGSQPVRR